MEITWNSCLTYTNIARRNIKSTKGETGETLSWYMDGSNFLFVFVGSTQAEDETQAFHVTVECEWSSLWLKYFKIWNSYLLWENSEEFSRVFCLNIWKVIKRIFNDLDFMSFNCLFLFANTLPATIAIVFQVESSRLFAWKKNQKLYNYANNLEKVLKYREKRNEDFFIILIVFKSSSILQA